MHNVKMQISLCSALDLSSRPHLRNHCSTLLYLGPDCTFLLLFVCEWQISKLATICLISNPLILAGRAQRGNGKLNSDCVITGLFTFTPKNWALTFKIFFFNLYCVKDIVKNSQCVHTSVFFREEIKFFNNCVLLNRENYFGTQSIVHVHPGFPVSFGLNDWPFKTYLQFFYISIDAAFTEHKEVF